MYVKIFIVMLNCLPSYWDTLSRDTLREDTPLEGRNFLAASAVNTCDAPPHQRTPL